MGRIRKCEFLRVLIVAFSPFLEPVWGSNLAGQFLTLTKPKIIHHPYMLNYEEPATSESTHDPKYLLVQSSLQLKNYFEEVSN